MKINWRKLFPYFLKAILSVLVWLMFSYLTGKIVGCDSVPPMVNELITGQPESSPVTEDDEQRPTKTEQAVMVIFFLFVGVSLWYFADSEPSWSDKAANEFWGPR